MTKQKATTLLELVVTVGIIIVVAQFSYVTINKLKVNNKNIVLLKKAYDSIESVLDNNKVSGTPSINWDWNSGDVYEVSKNILEKHILPFYYKKTSCSNPMACVGGFLSLNKEEYVNYKQATDYASALVGEENFHYSIKATKNCQKNNPTSLCGLFVIDVDNRGGYNQLGQDVFMFGFYGDGSFKPYGYHFSKEKIDAGCNLTAYGDTCAAKIISEGWSANYLNKK